MNQFRTEEITLICLYNEGTRLGTIAELRDMMHYLADDETELKRLSEEVIASLCRMSDEEYNQLVADIAPDFMIDQY